MPNDSRLEYPERIIWNYYEPIFEYEKIFYDIGWPWAGHKSFAYDFIANLKPNRIVELGTYKGTSLFAFCQAVKDHVLETEIIAVDTWEGDEHSGYYKEDIFQKICDIKNAFYCRLNLRLSRKLFDEAVTDFENNSIDLLHIDGLHTYEAVAHDFEKWLPKVKNEGIIFFHDINVGEGDFGVYKLWDRLKEKYSTIEFYHSFGLGILFVSKEIAGYFLKYQKEWQMHYSYIYETRKNLDIFTNEQLKQEIKAMKLSKFWKLRNIYVKLFKGDFG